MSTTITLDDDVAPVLFELLASERLDAGLDAADRNALWQLEGYLEKSLVRPFSPDYSKMLDQAKASLVQRFGS